MILAEIFQKSIKEKEVDSSWLKDIAYTKRGNVVLRLSDGRKYLVKAVPPKIFDDWLRAKSKGQFWHKYVRTRYKIYRLAR